MKKQNEETKYYTVETETRKIIDGVNVKLIHCSKDSFYDDDLELARSKALECYEEKMYAASEDETLANPEYEKDLFSKGIKNAWSIHVYLNVIDGDDSYKIDIHDEENFETITLEQLN